MVYLIIWLNPSSVTTLTDKQANVDQDFYQAHEGEAGHKAEYAAEVGEHLVGNLGGVIIEICSYFEN